MAHLKRLLYIFIPVAAVFLMSHNTSAASTTVNITNFSGFYGYQVGNNTPGRNVNLSGSIPLEVLTATASTEKDLYGIGQNYTFNISEASTYKVSTRFVLRQRVDTYNVDTPQNNKTSTWTFSDNTTTTTNCTVRYDYETSYYLVVFDCSYSGSKRPVRSSATLGITSGFTVGSTSPIMYSLGNGTSIDVYLSQYTYELFDDSGAAIVDSINGLSDDINAQFDKENQAVENISNQTEPAIDNSASTSILNNAASLFNQILTVPKGNNCQVPADWGNLNLGLLDFCQGKNNFLWVVNFVSSISVVVIVIGTSIILVRQILGLYDWARGK